MIHSLYFHDLLDCLAGQFFNTGFATCVEKDFGINISSSAKEYFCVDIVSEELSNDLAVLGVLFDDSVYDPSRNGFTFVIYIDLRKYSKNIQRIFSSIIIAHEICHFAFYYEFFIKNGDNTGIRSHSDFTHAVSSRFFGAVTSEQDNTSQTVVDEHNIYELVKTFGKYNKTHFTKGSNSLINYYVLFYDFLKCLKYEQAFEDFEKAIEKG